MSDNHISPAPSVATAQKSGLMNVKIVGSGDLILIGGNHAVLRLFSAEGQPAVGSVETFWANAAARADICSERGISFATWVFPDKLILYSDEPEFAGLDVASLFRRHYVSATRSQSRVSYLGDVIQDRGDFQQTDTHLSAMGMSKAVAAMARYLDLPDRENFVKKAAATWQEDAKHIGDLGVKFDPPLGGQALIPKRIVEFRHAFNGLAAGNDGIIDLIDSPQAASDKTLLIFGDSFFGQNLVYLSYFFRRIVFLRTRYFHVEMIDAIEPDVIFCGMAERFLSNVSPDAERPHFLAYPLQSGRPMTPSDRFAELWAEMINMRGLL